MVILNNINRADTQLLLWCGKSHGYPKFIRVVSALSHTGDGYLQLALPLLVWLFYPTLGDAFVLHCAVAFVIERVLYLVLKPSLARRRPPEVVPSFSSVIRASDKFSFPSGHSMASFLLATIAYMHLGVAAAILFIWAGAVAISRVLLGVHFPTDIVAGALLGATIGILTF